LLIADIVFHNFSLVKIFFTEAAVAEILSGAKV